MKRLFASHLQGSKVSNGAIMALNKQNEDVDEEKHLNSLPRVVLLTKLINKSTLN